MRGFFVFKCPLGKRTCPFSLCGTTEKRRRCRKNDGQPAKARLLSHAETVFKFREAKYPRAPTAPTCALPHPHSRPPRRARRQCDDTARESKPDCALPPSPRHAPPEKGDPFAQPREQPTRHRSRSVRKVPPTIRATPPSENPCRAIPYQAAEAKTMCAKNRPTTTDKSPRQREGVRQTQPIVRQCPLSSVASNGAHFRSPQGNAVRPRTKVPKANLPDRPTANGRAGKSIEDVSKQGNLPYSSLNESAVRRHREVLSSDNRKHRRRRSRQQSSRAPVPSHRR